MNRADGAVLRLLLYSALAAAAGWVALELLYGRRLLPDWATPPAIRLAAPVLFLLLVCGGRQARRIWRGEIRFSLRSVCLFNLCAACLAFALGTPSWRVARTQSIEKNYGYCLSPDGRLIGGVGPDGRERFWLADSGAALAHPPDLREGARQIWLGCLSPDWRYSGAIVGGNRAWEGPGQLRLWDIERGREVTPAGLNDVRHFYFSADSQRLLTVSQSGQVGLWDLSGAESFSLSLPARDCREARISPDGARFLTVGADGGLTVREARTGAALPGWPVALPPLDFTFLEFSADGARIIAETDDGLTILATTSGQKVAEFRPPVGSRMSIVHLAHAGDRLWIAIDCIGPPREKLLKLVDLSSGRELAAVDFAGAQYWMMLTSSPDGKCLWVNDPPRLFDAATGRLLAAWALELGMQNPWFIDHKKVVTQTFGVTGRIVVLEAATGRELAAVAAGRDTVAGCGGGKILTAGNELRLWTRVRPEHWWGFVVLPAAWVGAALLPLFLWSVAANRRRRTRQ